jgi:hypothetical protein
LTRPRTSKWRRLRDKTKAALLPINGLGAKEAKARLDEVGRNRERGKKVRLKKTRKS